jgi:hypothetical protein
MTNICITNFEASNLAGTLLDFGVFSARPSGRAGCRHSRFVGSPVLQEANHESKATGNGEQRAFLFRTALLAFGIAAIACATASHAQDDAKVKAGLKLWKDNGCAGAMAHLPMARNSVMVADRGQSADDGLMPQRSRW